VYDPKMALHRKFVFDKELYYDLGGEFMTTGPWARNSDDKLKKNPSVFYFLSHINELDIYQSFEDDFDCSGMCKTGLFYFGRNTGNGPPKDTCLTHFKKAFSH